MALLKWKYGVAATGFLLCMAWSCGPRADDGLRLAEQDVQAALLYNFLKYTDWPALRLLPEQPMKLCLFGDDSFNGYLQPMAARTVNQHGIAIRSLHEIGDADNCHLIFVNAAERVRWPELRDFLRGKSVLTVSNMDQFSAKGGMIAFDCKSGRVQVLLNIDSVHAAGLQVQDRLLKLVTLVHDRVQAVGRP